MKYFLDFNVDKNYKIGITSLLSRITTKPDSHKGGWTRLLKCQLEGSGYQCVKILTNKDSLNSFDVIIFDMGAEFSGALNLFGGLDEKVYRTLSQLKQFQGQLFSWRTTLPNVSILESRRNNQSSCQAFKDSPDNFLQSVQSVLNKCNVFDHAYATDTLLVGDSHTPGLWTPKLTIERRDGRTLAGAVKNKTITKLWNSAKYENLMVHVGSIDIRHHIMRSEEPYRELSRLVIGLADEIEELNPKSVTLCHTMGIEDESRKLPKTGYYKGSPFYGSQKERNKARLCFNALINAFASEKGWNVIKYPEYFFENSDYENGKLLFEVMESPKSVHISPSHYRWNLDKNENRWGY